ncbi:MAG TPA: glycosyltransferase family 2 protein [Stellaceae bacterium]|nr:glycosyltransferase family 2 protein [Stellaceae bacterium]
MSVVIPTFDRPSYLRIALASAVAQSYRNLEIIICDNGSRQDPTGMIAEFADPRIRLHRNASNIGQTPNFLTGIGMATGRYIALLGDDDVWHPDFVSTLIAPMRQGPEIIVSFCDHDIIDANGDVSVAATDRVTRRFGRHLLHEGVFRSFDDIALVYRAICVVSGSLIRKDSINWALIPRDLPISIDLYIAYLLATADGSCWFTSTHLMQYRYHALQGASSFTNIHRSWRNDLRWMLELWMTFLRDDRLKCRSYLKMICARKAMFILVDRLLRRDLDGIGADLSQFFRFGLLNPSMLYYHLVYFLRFQRLGMGRMVP